MRPIGCSLGLTEGSLKSKKILLVASQNGPLSLEGSTRGYPGYPPGYAHGKDTETQGQRYTLQLRIWPLAMASRVLVPAFIIEVSPN